MTDVIMPQMGESIAEGTITKWLKKVGDKVQRDEPLFEISTDKVDAEIPAPAGGVLKEIRVEPGATVPIKRLLKACPDPHHISLPVVVRIARMIASGVAGASRRGIIAGFRLTIASLMAEKTEMASIRGGSPTAFDR